MNFLVRRPLAAMVAGATAVVATAQSLHAQQPTVMPPVQVIGASPLIGSGIDRNSVPAATHVLDYRDVERRGVPDLLWSLNQEIGGVDPRFGVGQSLPADSLLSRLSSLTSAA
jgi:iron complex outermembrane recepter protein